RSSLPIAPLPLTCLVNSLSATSGFSDRKCTFERISTFVVSLLIDVIGESQVFVLVSHFVGLPSRLTACLHSESQVFADRISEFYPFPVEACGRYLKLEGTFSR